MYNKPLITLEDIDNHISKFLPKLFFDIEEDPDRNVVVWVPDYAMKLIFTELCSIISKSIAFKVLSMKMKRSKNEQQKS